MAFGFVPVLISFTEFCRNHSGLGVACNSGLRSIAISVSVCLYSRSRISKTYTSSARFRAYCLRFCPLLTALQYVVYFTTSAFVDDVIAHTGHAQATGTGRVLKVTREGPAQGRSVISTIMC